MKGKKCGVYVVITTILLIAVFLMTGCVEPIGLPNLVGNNQGNPSPNPTPNVGTLRLSIVGSTGARTIMPENPGVESYGVALTATSGGISIEEQEIDFSSITTQTINNVPVGIYTVTVIGYKSADLEDPIAMGFEAGVEVAEGESNETGVIVLKPYDTTGTGTFSWLFEDIITGLDLDAGDTATMTFEVLGGGASLPLEPSVDLIDSGNGALTLNAGYYNVIIEINKEDYFPFTLNRVLHVYQNMESEWDPEESFVLIYTGHTIDYNLNDGVNALPPSPAEVTHGGTITIAPTEPSRAGYIFTGWWTANDGAISGVKWVFGGIGTGTRVLRSRTLWAGWELIITADLEITIEEFDFEEIPLVSAGEINIDMSEIEAADAAETELVKTIAITNAVTAGLSSFVWSFNGTIISGQTGATLSFDLMEFVDILTAPATYTLTVRAMADGKWWSALIDVNIIDD